jgi:hypothetical protein
MNHVSELPDLESLEQLLAVHRGARAFVVPMTGPRGGLLGNNGDQIMHRVFDRILGRLEITSVPVGEAADVVIVPPNGALLEIYQFPELLKQRIEGYRDVPLVLFPSSAFFPTRNPAFMFEGRSAATTWILREHNSLSHLESLWGEALASAGVTLQIDHDVVASGHTFVDDILPKKVGAPIALVAARVDVEGKVVGARSTTASPSGPRLLKRLRRAIPYSRLTTLAARLARRSKQRAAGERIVASLPTDLRAELAAVGARTVYSDASAVQYATFAEYARLIRSAEIVVTNRLHVALPATVLGKRVILVDAGYHKLSGVYQRSLSGAPNVTLVQGAK